MITRKKILNDAEAHITGDRNTDYGGAFTNFNDIARIWSVILSKQITREDVSLCMIAVKLARLKTSPDHIDSWVDLAGYAAIGGELGSMDSANKIALAKALETDREDEE